MFKINNIIDQNGTIHSIELMSPNKSSYAKIVLGLGGSLQELLIENKQIIKNIDLLDYKLTYASAILFPFANRVKNGTYTFQNKKYALNINMEEEKSALHGLVYNKVFKSIKTDTSENAASVTIGYDETEKSKGFPFKFSIYLTYTLTTNALELKVLVKNKDQEPLPFNLGWHPYFLSSNLYDSFLKIKSHRKLVLDEDMIPVNVKSISIKDPIQIKDTLFDDCFILSKNSINFKTPKYHINLSSSSKDNYLQVFTPKKVNAIALEPITGPANSLNHKHGLQILEPNESYDVKWKIKLKENE